tara:strand:+ start:264 stop:368 length:105 start_codon:yes stop_codon:yes gene_type:complete
MIISKANDYAILVVGYFAGKHTSGLLVSGRYQKN